MGSQICVPSKRAEFVTLSEPQQTARPRRSRWHWGFEQCWSLRHTETTSPAPFILSGLGSDFIHSCCDHLKGLYVIWGGKDGLISIYPTMICIRPPKSGFSDTPYLKPRGCCRTEFLLFFPPVLAFVSF